MFNNYFDKLLVNIPQFKDSRGELSVIDDSNMLIPFFIKRVFWITNVPQLKKRGNHAHCTTNELLIVLRGALTVKLTHRNESRTFLLDSSTVGLWIPPYYWCELSNFQPDTICLCVADEDYNEKGYINDFELFSHLEL